MIEGTAPDCLTEAGRGWVSHIFVRRWLVLSLLSLIYIICPEASSVHKVYNKTLVKHKPTAAVI